MFSILSPFESLETWKYVAKRARMKLPFCGERPGLPAPFVAVSVVIVTRGFVAG